MDAYLLNPNYFKCHCRYEYCTAALTPDQMDSSKSANEVPGVICMAEMPT